MSSETDPEPDGMFAYHLAIANPDPTDPTWPLPSFDARDWAKAFCEKVKATPTIATDEATMLAWFASSLMRGYDEAQRRLATTPGDRPMSHPLLQFFAYAHMPEHLQVVSKPFGDLAQQMEARLPNNPEKTMALRKLLEAKDCAVRAVLFKPAEEAVPQAPKS